MNAQLMREPITQSGTRCSKRQAFTLVELLVVITIIGILVALLIPAVNVAMRNARNAQIAIEVRGLANAMESYKLEMGDYPPDFARDAGGDGTQIVSHLARKFRYRDKVNDVYSDADLDNLDPSEALVFWLSGLSADPKRPLTNRKAYSDLFPATVKGAKAFFEFDQSRLRDSDGDGWPEYYPQNIEMPYVYFRNDNYANPFDNSLPHAVLNNQVQVRPYARTLDGAAAVDEYVAPEKFQVICSGLDNLFLDENSVASNATYPDGLGYQEADEDNITNFSEGSTLQAAIP